MIINNTQRKKDKILGIGILSGDTKDTRGSKKQYNKPSNPDNHAENIKMTTKPTDMKLKTLKDFIRKQCSNFEEKDGSIVRFIDERELKAEAIKYYFDLKEHKEIDETTCEALIIEGAMRWIKHFFNLTEEDIK